MRKSWLILGLLATLGAACSSATSEPAHPTAPPAPPVDTTNAAAAPPAADTPNPTVAETSAPPAPNTAAPVIPPAPEEHFTPGDPKLCLTGGNVLVLWGDPKHEIHKDHTVVRDGMFSAYGSDQQNHLRLRIEDSRKDQGSPFGVEFSTRRLAQTLRPGDYRLAEGAPSESHQRPGFSLTSHAQICGNSSLASFKIHDITWSGSHVAKVTATFTQQCRGHEPSLSGCVHYENPLLLAERGQKSTVPQASASLDPSPCAGGGNVLWLNGEASAHFHPGEELLRDVQMYARTGTSKQNVDLTVLVPGRDDWKIEFKSPNRTTPLAIKRYLDANETSKDHPDLYIAVGSSTCGGHLSRFQIHELSFKEGAIDRVLASFEHQCIGQSPVLRGCVAYDAAAQPPAAAATSTEPTPAKRPQAGGKRLVDNRR